MAINNPGSSTRGPVNKDDFPTSFPGGKVLVTGASGHIGSHVVHTLAKAGFQVHGTSRSPERVKAWNEKWPKAGVTWSIVGDNDTPSNYDEAAKGAIGIFHVAGPYHFQYKASLSQTSAGVEVSLTMQTSEEMINNTREGILNVLRAAQKQSTVTRVVHVNSLASITIHDPDKTNGAEYVYDETTWNHHDPAISTGARQGDAQYAYTTSKKLGEQASLKWMEENKPKFDLVTLCPSTNYGRLLYPAKTLADIDTSANRLYNYLNEALKYSPKNPYPNYTAVKDTARAALNAFVYPNAGGKRYQLTSGDYSYQHIFYLVKKNFPEQAHRFPEIADKGLPFAARQTVDVSLAERDLGMRWSPLEEVLCEEVADLFALEAQS